MGSRKALAAIVSLLGGLFAFGCGGGGTFSGNATGDAGNSGSGGGGGVGNNGPTLSQIPEEYAAAMCAALSNCSVTAANLFLGANDCTSLVAAQIRNGSFPGIQAAVAAGTAKYDPTSVQACTNAVKMQGCTFSNEPYFAECEQALSGTVDERGACSINEECKGDLYCKYSGTCPGTCAPREAKDALCRATKDCQSGLTCFVSTGTTGRCATKPTLGQDCGMDLPSECASQSNDAVICWGASDTKRGKCVAVNAIASEGIGSDCGVASSSLCVFGASCQITELLTLSGTCVASAAAASGCPFAYPDPCAKDQYCTAISPNSPGTCSLLPTAGQPCVTGLLQQYSNKICAADHVCVDGTCIKYRGNGESCSSDTVCYSGRCDSQGQQCVTNANCDIVPR